MKIKPLIYPLPFLLLLFPFQVNAESPVWEIEKNGHSIFLGGTFHILTSDDYPLPNAFDIAYNQSAQVIFETDLQKLQDPAFQPYMLRKLSYTEGHSVQEVVSKETFLAVKTFFEDREIPFDSIANFRPGMIVMMMTMVELQRLGLVGTGVDSYFSEKAKNDGKKSGRLETVDDQLAFIASMGAGREDELLKYNIAELDRLPRLWQAMKEAWREGDMSKLEEIGIDQLENEFADLSQSLITDRNNAWMPQIEAMLATNEIEFILVGSLHLAGDEGLLAKLAARGYKIRQLR